MVVLLVVARRFTRAPLKRRTFLSCEHNWHLYWYPKTRTTDKYASQNRGTIAAGRCYIELVSRPIAHGIVIYQLGPHSITKSVSIPVSHHQIRRARAGIKYVKTSRR